MPGGGRPVRGRAGRRAAPGRAARGTPGSRPSRPARARRAEPAGPPGRRRGWAPATRAGRRCSTRWRRAAAHAVWQALPGEAWAERLAEAAAATVARRRGARCWWCPTSATSTRCTPPAWRGLGADAVVALTAELGPAERYRRWLAVRRGAVAGRRRHPVGGVRPGRRAGPARGLGRRRRPARRAARALPARPRRAGRCAPTRPARRCWSAGFAPDRRGAAAGRVRVGQRDRRRPGDRAGRDAAGRRAGRDRRPARPGPGGPRGPAARRSAFEAARAALAAGRPVLVQVPRARLPAVAGLRAVPGDRPAAATARARSALPRRRDRRSRGRGCRSCRWCGRAESAFRCGAAGRAGCGPAWSAPAAPPRSSGGRSPAPVRRSGGGAPVLADGGRRGPRWWSPPRARSRSPPAATARRCCSTGGRCSARPDLRVAEETLRRWMAAAALVRAARRRRAGGRDGRRRRCRRCRRWCAGTRPGTPPPSSPPAPRSGFPPAVRMAAVDGQRRPRVAEVLDELGRRPPAGPRPGRGGASARSRLGPVELEPDAAPGPTGAAARTGAGAGAPGARAGRWPPRCTPRRRPAPPARRPIRCGSGSTRRDRLSPRRRRDARSSRRRTASGPRRGRLGRSHASTGARPRSSRRSVTVQPIRLFGDPVLRTPAAEVDDLRRGAAQAGRRPDRHHARRGRRRPRRAAARRRPAGVHLRLRRLRRAPGQPDLRRRRRRGAGRPGGLPVDPRACSWDCRRHLHVVARGWNSTASRSTIEGSELLARCIQHETDHLDGVLFVDRLDPATRKAAMAEIRAAEWFGAPAPDGARRARTRSSGRPGSGDAAGLRRHPRAGACPSLRGAARRRRGTRWWPCVTRPDAPAGRGRTLAPLAGRRAGRRGRHPGAHPARRPRDPDVPRPAARARARTAARWSPTARCCPAPRWTCPAHGWVNLHFSLLPAWRGAAPVQAALRHGDEITGATTFRLEEGLDTGPVFGVVTEAVRPDRHRRRRCSAGSPSPAPRCCWPRSTASRTARLRPRRSRPTASRTRPKVTADDARVDWAAPAAAVDRLVRVGDARARARGPTFRGERLELGPVDRAVADAAASSKPGRAARREARVLVGTAAAPVAAGRGAARSASARCRPPTGPAACASSRGSC